ncbi:MAG: NAD(+)/NADH kinase [Verrucomicrobiota bacterium]
MGKKITGVVLLLNSTKKEGNQLAQEVAEICMALGVELTVFESLAKVSSEDIANVLEVSCGKNPLIIVGGGDGSLLRAARICYGFRACLLGVNLGSLGFLSSLRKEEVCEHLGKILKGHYKISKRNALNVELWKNQQCCSKSWALNEAVISRGQHSHMIKVCVEIDGVLMTEYHCDGLIVSTATGSTAYSLSAGGPIVSPKAKAIIITPICPHALSNRPVVVDASEKVRIYLPAKNPGMILQVDGLEIQKMRPGDAVHLGVAECPIELLQLSDASFYEILRQKLRWSGTNV